MDLRAAVVSVLVSVAVAVPGAAIAQTLEEALAAAYNNNPTLAAQRAQLRQTDEQVPQALSNWRPTLEAFGNVGKARREQNEIRPGVEHVTPRLIGGRIVQPLYRGGRTLAATRSAENAVLAGRAGLLDVEQSVLLSGVQTYVNVLAAKAVLDFNIQNEQRLTRFLEATRDRFEVGEVTRTDVFQAEARLANATADRVQAEGDLDATRAAYRNVIGEEPGDLILPEMPRDLPSNLDEAVAIAIEQNPAVVAAEYSERSARDAVDNVRGELLLSLNLEGQAFRSVEESINGLRTNELRAVVNLELPIYQAGAVYSRLREAKQNVSQRLRELDQERRDAREEATRAWNDLQAARAEVRARDIEVEANEVAVEGVEREQAVGTRTVLDVLDTQRDLIDSQQNQVRARRDEIFESYRLMASIGSLTARDLGLAVEYYDPEQHYLEVRDRWFGASSTGDISDEPVLSPR